MSLPRLTSPRRSPPPASPFDEYRPHPEIPASSPDGCQGPLSCCRQRGAGTDPSPGGPLGITASERHRSVTARPRPEACPLGGAARPASDPLWGDPPGPVEGAQATWPLPELGAWWLGVSGQWCRGGGSGSGADAKPA